jgi:hypothetical protein
MKFIIFIILSLIFIGCYSSPIIKTTLIEGQKFQVNYDEFQKITWYIPYNKDVSDYSDRIYLYFGIRDDSSKHPILRFTIKYTSSDWLFIKNCLFKIDNEIIPYKFSEPNRWVDNNAEIFEISDMPVDSSSLNLIKKIITGKSVKIRFEGDKGIDDLTIPVVYCSEMSNVLAIVQKRGWIY